MSVEEVGPGQSRVVWVSNPTLKGFGKPLSPVLKLGLGRTFDTLLKELKAFAEGAAAAA